MSTEEMNLSTYLAEKIVDNTTHDFYPEGGNHPCSGKNTFCFNTNKQNENNPDKVVDSLQNIEQRINGILTSEADLNKHLYRFGEEGDFNQGQFFFRLYEKGGNGSSFQIQTGNIIGSIRAPLQGSDGSKSIRLNIGSRFGEAFLRRLISSAEGFVHLDDTTSSGSTEKKTDDIDYLLLLVWQIKMERALLKGLPKLYRQVREYSHTFRGSIDFNRFFNSPGIQCPLPMSYPMLSHNNPVTQLLSLTTHIVSKRYGYTGFGASSLPVWKNIFTGIADPLTIDHRRLKKAVIKNPYFHEYREVIHLSEMILRNAQLGIWGGREDLDLFLFDISMLFEHYVRQELKNHGYPVLPKEAAAHIPHGGSYKNGLRKLIPDIVIEGKDGLKIFDVKYKRFNQHYGADREDLFQVISYASAFEKVDTLGLIYPQDEGIQECIVEKTITLSGTEKRLMYIFIPTKDGEAKMTVFLDELKRFLS